MYARPLGFAADVALARDGTQKLLHSKRFTAKCEGRCKSLARALQSCTLLQVICVAVRFTGRGVQTAREVLRGSVSPASIADAACGSDDALAAARHVPRKGVPKP